MNVKIKPSLLVLPVLLFLLFSGSAINKASIRIIYPNGGEVLKTGSSVTIKWQWKNASGKVILILYKKGIKHSIISKQAANTGMFRWKIPRNIPVGSDYRVRIRVLKKLYINDFSDGNFTIKK